MRLLLLAFVFLTSCGTPGTVKVYYLDPARGLVREQQKEVRKFQDSRGYLCESQDDFRDTVTCTGAAVKVWFLEPSKGLVRKQQNQMRSFQESKGYLCVSPQDMKQILAKCKEQLSF